MTKKLYYDGDSFSCSVDDTDPKGYLPRGQKTTTGHILAERLGLDLEHYGFPRKSPAQIIRSAVRYSLIEQDSLMLIGIGVVQRLEYFTNNVPSYSERDKEYKRWLEEDSIRGFQIYDATRETQQLFHWQYMEVNVLFNLLQLHDYLIHNNKNFIIHNLGYNFDIDSDFVFANKIYKQIQDRPRFVNIFENSLHQIIKDKNLKPHDYDQYGWDGHPDEQGHAAYADFLWDYILDEQGCTTTCYTT